MKYQPDTNQQGFTLVELLIATTVFSIILLVAAATLIQVGRMYYKGIITSKTQSAARSSLDDVTRSIQFSNGSISRATDGTAPKIEAVCLGNNRYTYVLGAQVDEKVPDGSYSPTDRKIRHALWQDTIGAEACGNDLPKLQYADPYTDAANPDRNGKALLEDGMRLQKFTVDPQAGSDDVFAVNIKVVYYADPELLNDFDNPTTCKGSVVGGQWCAISDLASVVYSRAN